MHDNMCVVCIYARTGILLSNADVSFGPKSFTEYIYIGGPAAAGTVILQVTVKTETVKT
jgi:hypothetical protein